MTNEEQSAILSGRAYGIKQEIANTIYDIALDMAQWKDEQYAAEKKALIDKACEWLANNYQNLDYINMEGDLFDLSMVEDFRKAMEETK